jgi:PAS domain-containing protein
VSLHPLLKQQFEDARQASGPLDLRKLLQAISAAYGEWDEERRGVVRSMKLLADETSAYTREVRESAASQLQVILDHVKDAILTVDEDGRVETLNSIGERVFGYEEDAVRGRKLVSPKRSRNWPSPSRTRRSTWRRAKPRRAARTAPCSMPNSA